MSIASGVRGPARIELIRNHRVMVFTRVFGEYIDGKASVDDVKVRALNLPQRGDAHGL
ncbi:hypothetical protein ES703_94605 [subsurface metagenome]